MMMLKRKVLVCSMGAALAALSGGAAASGFALIEEGASGLGNAYAGGAASADDASTIFFNPAGMANLSGKQLAVTMNAIKPSAQYGGTLSGGALIATATGGVSGDAGSLNWVPNAHFVMEVNPQMRFGLSLNSPFGLKTSYDPTWMGRFQAINSSINTVNLNPSLSWQVNDTVSIGGGVSYQTIKGELSSATNYFGAVYAATLAAGAPAAVAAATAAGATAGGMTEGITTVSGSDNAWGYNLGVLFKPSPQTRVGLAYRSKIKYLLTGSVTFSSRPAALAAALPDGPINLAITMPDNFSASVFHQLDERWDIMADASWTGWSVLQQLKIDRVTGANLSTVPENWHDTWRVAVGGNYHYNPQWTARIGVAYDQSPVPDAFRTARIPDNDRTWLSLGGQYKPARESAVDFAYAHLFVKGTPVNQNAANNTNLNATTGFLTGSYSNSVDILSVQYTYSF